MSNASKRHCVRHTPEPWVLDKYGVVRAGPPVEYFNGYGQDQIAAFHGSERIGDEERQANAARSVACVNACQGLVDPKKHLDLMACALHEAAIAFRDLQFAFDQGDSRRDECRNLHARMCAALLGEKGVASNG